MPTVLKTYKVPEGTRIGHVHLKVSNLQRSLDFYHGLLGFDLMVRMGEDAAFLSAGGYHHHIGLNTWYSKDAPAAPQHAAGLYHTAILYPDRKDLALVYRRLDEAGYPFTGFADHGVSEALYLDDPDKNGVELYWDRPRESWPLDQDGRLIMYTRKLDIPGLLKEIFP
ncbi:MAG TPA: VOC family protein [Chitinophagaceae bacterium]|nr:VOC family protein [Chitinophagaceae bacterium]